MRFATDCTETGLAPCTADLGCGGRIGFASVGGLRIGRGPGGHAHVHADSPASGQSHVRAGRFRQHELRNPGHRAVRRQLSGSGQCSGTRGFCYVFDDVGDNVYKSWSYAWVVCQRGGSQVLADPVVVGERHVLQPGRDLLALAGLRQRHLRQRRPQHPSQPPGKRELHPRPLGRILFGRRGLHSARPLHRLRRCGRPTLPGRARCGQFIQAVLFLHGHGNRPGREDIRAHGRRESARRRRFSAQLRGGAPELRQLVHLPSPPRIRGQERPRQRDPVVVGA